MASPSFWSRDETYSFPVSYLLPPLDFSGISFPGLDLPNDLPIRETQNFPSDSLYSSINIGQIGTPNQHGFSYDYGDEGGASSGINGGLGFQENPNFTVERKVKRQREEKNSSSKILSRDTISQFFYMPITQAAKELNVGLTLLKKRCRELGIRRWPHRKLISLQTLIQNVQDLSKEEGDETEGKLKDALEILKMEKKVMEEIPDLQLEDNTKRLRQVCFKANYKRRKVMAMADSPPSSSFNSNFASIGEVEFEEDESMKSLLSQCSFSSSITF